MEMVAGWCIRPEQRDQAMQVERVRPGATPVATRKAAAADGFSQLLETRPEGGAVEDAGGASAAAAPGAPVAAAPLSGLMSYEQACERVQSDRNARRHGRAMLQALRALQVVVLEDGDTAAAALSHLAADIPEADDPVLRLILREIGVRAAVELARYQAPADISIS
jgi:hypothetical protein